MTPCQGHGGQICGAETALRAKYENLRVWSESMDLSEQIYTVTRTFPRREDFALTSQFRRSAVSVPSNIAEGCGRYHTKEFVQFLYVARGSLFELMTLLELSVRFEYVSDGQYERLREKCEGVLAGLSALLRSLEARTRL